MKPGSTADKLVTLLFLLGGFAAVGFGLWQVYPPAVWIFGGLVALYVANDFHDAATQPEKKAAPAK